MKKWKCECNECKFAPCTMETNNVIRPACCAAMTGRFSEWQEVKEEEETVTACNHFPKLTAEVFDRPDCPEWAKYAVVDSDGYAWWYKDVPTRSVGGKWFCDDTYWKGTHGIWDASDWQNSLIERPKKLPLGADAGAVVKVSRYRTLTVIDPVPVPLPDGTWEQKFSQTGQITLYGRTTQFSGQCRILWKYEPSMENIMDEPLFEDQGECPE